ncbi:MAG: TldD/PmbA family protein [Actinomycetes bacterium]
MTSSDARSPGPSTAVPGHPVAVPLVGVHQVDEDFLALPLGSLADTALARADQLGASHADVRVERIRSYSLRLRDARTESMTDLTDLGIAVRVVHDGAWGFAAGMVLTARAARDLVDRAVAMARVARTASPEAVQRAEEPAHPDTWWVSAYDRDPFDVADAEKVAHLAEASHRLLAADPVHHVDASLQAVKEQKFYADSAGTRATQQRVRTAPSYTVVHLGDGGGFETLRTLAPPTGRGAEYLTGTGWDWTTELDELPSLLAEKVAAPGLAAGRYDLVIDPSNLWLTIHESVGHATELDRALGYEANYAGTSFATPDQLGRLRYGSPLMHVTADRVTPHGLATIGIDDDGVAAQSWDLVRDGLLVGYQLDRSIAHRIGSVRSNGCAFADSPEHMPLQRMANVSLAADPQGPDVAGLVAGVTDGVYVVGDNSWSIDMARYNFQFTAQRFYRIRAGRLVGQVKDIAYQATTTEFWGSLAALGGPSTWVLGGAFTCGKAQPAQVAPVSHGAPAAVFSGVRVLDTRAEGGG